MINRERSRAQSADHLESLMGSQLDQPRDYGLLSYEQQFDDPTLEEHLEFIEALTQGMA